VAVRWHRSVEGTIKTARICRTAGQWYVCFVCELPDPMALESTGQASWDRPNVENLLVDSNNERIESPKYYRWHNLNFVGRSVPCSAQRRQQEPS